jgi:hypothetical protein
MFPIKLTEHHYINPDAVLYAEFRPGDAEGDDAGFAVVLRNNDYNPLWFRGPQAEEAFSNWKAAYALTIPSQPIVA